MERIVGILKWLVLPADTKDKSAVMIYGEWGIRMLVITALVLGYIEQAGLFKEIETPRSNAGDSSVAQTLMGFFGRPTRTPTPDSENAWFGEIIDVSFEPTLTIPGGVYSTPAP